MVYTPVKTVVLGGNFLTIESLHHTLMTRQIEQFSSFSATSPYSAGVRRLLSRIAIMFTTMSGQTSAPVSCAFHLVLLQHSNRKFCFQYQDIYSSP